MSCETCIHKVVCRWTGGGKGCCEYYLQDEKALIGKTCYQICVIRPKGLVHGYPSETKYHHVISTLSYLDGLIKCRAAGEDVQIILREKGFTKSDRWKLGKLVF